MVRDALCLGLCAVLLCGAVSRLAAGPGDDSDSRIRNQLAVQAAFEKGRAHIDRGNFAEAVVCLEAQLPYIDGNRLYLLALRDAYQGHIRKLKEANRLLEARNYLERLDILDPNARRELAVPPPGPAGTPELPSDSLPAAPAPAPAPPPAPAPVAVVPTAPPSVVPARPPVAALASEAGPPRTPDRVVEAPAKMVRAKTDDEDFDPFGASNSAPNKRAAELLDRAERAFTARRYEEAGQLFEQAYRAEPASTRDCRVRWAYCKLYAVAKQLNQTEAPGKDLEQEVRMALSMAPREMDSFGKALLRQIQDRAEPASRVEVKHTPRPGGTGWAMAETTSFRIFHTQGQETAERAAQVAERTRAAMSRKWFADATPATWSPRCDIYLHATAADYARATGAPTASPGHSTLSLDGGRVIIRRIDLRCDDPNMLNGVLPHETTHVVLAGRFGLHHVPRWADEGAAVLSEPQDRVNQHLHNLPMHRRDGELFGVGQLMQMDKYPEPKLVGTFYAQSVSLVDYLSKRKGPQVFTAFLRDSLEHKDYEGALRKHYEINGFADLDRLWMEHAFGAVTADRR